MKLKTKVPLNENLKKVWYKHRHIPTYTAIDSNASIKNNLT